jgi:hypothetical protein
MEPETVEKKEVGAIAVVPRKTAKAVLVNLTYPAPT